MAQPLKSGRWRFAAHLGVSNPDAPLLLATAGSADPLRQIETAAALGFGGITDNSLKLRSGETQRAMGRLLRRLGLDMGTFTHDPPGQEAVFHWGARVDVAASLAPSLTAADRIGGGIVNLVILDAGTSRSEQLARAAGNLALAAELAGGAGVRLAVEPVSRQRMANALVERIGDAAALVRGVGHPALGLIMDSCHAALAGDDLAAEIRAHADILAAVQIADVPGRVEPGAGDIDFAPVMAALDAIGWQGLVEAEYHPARLGEAGEAAAIAALDAFWAPAS